MRKIISLFMPILLIFLLTSCSSVSNNTFILNDLNYNVSASTKGLNFSGKIVYNDNDSENIYLQITEPTELYGIKFIFNLKPEEITLESDNINFDFSHYINSGIVYELLISFKNLITNKTIILNSDYTAKLTFNGFTTVIKTDENLTLCEIDTPNFKYCFS